MAMRNACWALLQRVFKGLRVGKQAVFTEAQAS